MAAEFIFLLLIIIAGFVVLAWLIRNWITSSTQKPDQLVSELLRSFDTRSQEQSKEIRDQTRSLNERLDKAAQIIGSVQKNIGEFSEIGRSMRDLQEFLKSPKLRGNIGEEVLADLISQMFPKSSYVLQYQFRGGARVDAAIKTDAGIIPIDAKFPYENYQKMVKAGSDIERDGAKKEFTKDVKKHIEDISFKYIKTDEGTFDFALMYVPSEPVFYELVQITEVMNFAKRQRVYPVSPTTLYAHLQTILLSFAGKQIETNAREVFKLLRALSSDYEKNAARLGVLGKHITNAYQQMGQVNQGFSAMGQKLQLTQNLEIQSEQQKLVE